MCEKAIEEDPWQLDTLPDRFKNQEMCNKSIKAGPYQLKDAPHWFATQQQIDIWYDGDYCSHDYEIIECYEGYKKRKVQKASIKKELLPIAWHPSRY